MKWIAVISLSNWNASFLKCVWIIKYVLLLSSWSIVFTHICCYLKGNKPILSIENVHWSQKHSTERRIHRIISWWQEQKYAVRWHEFRNVRRSTYHEFKLNKHAFACGLGLTRHIRVYTLFWRRYLLVSGFRFSSF